MWDRWCRCTRLRAPPRTAGRKPRRDAPRARIIQRGDLKTASAGVGLRLCRTERARHGATGDDPAVDARDAFEHAHAAAEPNDMRFHFDDVAWTNRFAESKALDAGQKRQALTVFGL